MARNTTNTNHTRKKRNRWKALVIAGAVVLAAGFAWYSAGLYRQRQQAESEAEAWREGREQETAAGSGSEVLEYEGKTYRRNTYVKAILCMGIDRTDTLEEPQVAGSGGQSDGIFLVAQDTVRGQVKILMIPRDTMTLITLTDLSGNVLGKDIQHLTLAYAYGDGRELSCQYMSEAVSTLLNGLAIDGYMAVSAGALPLINDGVGGVTVTIEEEGLEAADPSFVQGVQVTLEGELAEKYIRYRDTSRPQTALERTERQKTYIQGFAEAAKRQAAREEGFAERMLNELQPYMVTDLDKGEYMDLALDFLESSQTLTQEDMITLPGEAEETNLYDVYFPDLNEILPIVLELFYRAEE